MIVGSGFIPTRLVTLFGGLLLVTALGSLSSDAPVGEASIGPDWLPSGCVGQLRSAIAQGAMEGFTLRDELTGEPITFPEGWDSNFNPGAFRGTAGVDNFLEFVRIDQPYIGYYGCVMRTADLTTCVDFAGGDPCGDSDDDSWGNSLEEFVGSDPSDASSTPENDLFDEQFGMSTCHDRADNDGDGTRDLRDEGCRN